KWSGSWGVVTPAGYGLRGGVCEPRTVRPRGAGEVRLRRPGLDHEAAVQALVSGDRADERECAGPWHTEADHGVTVRGEGLVHLRAGQRAGEHEGVRRSRGTFEDELHD